MGPDTTYTFLHHIRVIVTDPVTVVLGPEFCVILSALVFRWYGDRESVLGKGFWRLSGKLVTGGLGLLISGLLLFAARAESVMHSGSKVQRDFVQDFQAIGPFVGMLFVAFYFGVMAAARGVRSRKALLLDPVLPDFLAVVFLLFSSFILANVAKRL